MIQITVREFRANLKKYLVVPCQVVSHGKPIASIVPVKAGEKPDPAPLGMVKRETVYTPPIEYPTGGPLPKVVPFHDATIAGSTFRVCPHRNESGQCPMGCVEKL